MGSVGDLDESRAGDLCGHGFAYLGGCDAIVFGVHYEGWQSGEFV